MAKQVAVAFALTLCVAALQRCTCTTYYGHERGENLLGNSEFDDDIPEDSDDSWYALYPGEMEYGLTTKSCFSSCSCAYARNRGREEANFRSRVPGYKLKPDTYYWASMFVKITEDFLDDDLNITLRYKLSYNNETDVKTRTGAKIIFLRAAERWLYLSDDILTPNASSLAVLDWMDVFADVPINVSFILDATSLVEIPYPDWRGQAEENIETYRKADLTVRATIPQCMDPSLLTISINQTGHGFPFGCMTRAKILTDYDLGDSEEDNITREENAKYREYFKTRFHWTTFSYHSKWDAMEDEGPIEDDSKFEIPDLALEWLESEGVKTRGHCIHWNSDKQQPQYAYAIPGGQTLIDELYRRIDYMAEHYLDGDVNRFQHYDVSNEHPRSNYLEERTGNLDILGDLHMRTRQKDNVTMLFTNNYGVITYSHQTSRTINQIRYLQESGTIDGVGLQGHFNEETYMDLGPIMRRLDVFRGLGLPLWVTEFESQIPDLDLKADFMRDLYTLFFGIPEIQGIIFWGVEQLVDENYQSNPVGEMVDDLLRSEWRTELEVVPSGTTLDHTYRAFLVSYDVTAYYDGSVIATQSLELSQSHEIDLMFACFQ